jgi:hypothetical protein
MATWLLSRAASNGSPASAGRYEHQQEQWPVPERQHCGQALCPQGVVQIGPDRPAMPSGQRVSSSSSPESIRAVIVRLAVLACGMPAWRYPEVTRWLTR